MKASARKLNSDVTEVGLSISEFALFRDLIEKKTGISLGESKSAMLRSRLAKRLAHCGLSTFDEYYALLQDNDPHGKEQRELISCITTNKTSFFRENHHFEFLASQYGKSANGTPLEVWSAACATGEEPYSIAMCLLEAIGSFASKSVRITASDIDTKVLDHAKQGVYSESSLQDVPEKLRSRYFLRGAKNQVGFVRVKLDVRSLVSFCQINLIEQQWGVRGPFDVIFCRNALIYFERSNQDKILRRMIDLLKPTGYLIVGHSEHLHWMGDVLESIGLNIYRIKR